MKVGDWLVIVLTFFTGIAAGTFVYLNGFRDVDIDPQQPIAVDSFTITVSHYGGCARGGQCASYRVTDDGMYVLITNAETKEGSISADQLRSLVSALKTADVATQAVEREPDFCESWVDGIDSEYDIVVGGERYVLDTCGTAVDVDSDLIELLDGLWQQFSDQS